MDKLVEAYSLEDDDSTMSNFYQIASRTDDIYENCYLAIKDVTEIETTVGYLYSYNGIGVNILYNLGYMFTDILDLVFYDPTNTESYWYYVAFRVGDILIRFIYRDDEDSWKEKLYHLS